MRRGYAARISRKGATKVCGLALAAGAAGAPAWVHAQSSVTL